MSDPVAFTTSNYALMPAKEWARYIVFRPTVQIGFQLVSGGIVNNFISGCLRFVRCTI
jgi:hypothetical protein